MLTSVPALSAPTATASVPALRRSWRVFVFTVAVLVLWFGFLELRGLYFPDEGRYAEIPREMVASGDWVTPTLNGIVYFEKPPLQYWATALVFRAFGEDEWTARLAPALAGFVALLAVLATARKLYSRRVGWLAAAVLASSAGYFGASQFVTLDVMLTALLTGALCAFLLAQHDGATPQQTRVWMAAAWLLCALAFLTKGAIAIVLPGVAVVTYAVARRDATLARRLHVGIGIVLMSVVIVPWLVAVERRHPGFLHFFFVVEHWERFLQPSHQRTGAWWYFLPIGAAFLMPWLPAIVAGFGRQVGPARPAPRFDPAVFAWCWAGAILLFFSLSSSKLPAYILPALPGVALGAAPRLARAWRRSLRLTTRTLVPCALVMMALAYPAARALKVDTLREAYLASAHWIVAGGLVLVITAVLARAIGRRRPVAALMTVVVGGMLGCQLAMVTAARIDAYFSAERLIETISGGEARRPFEPGVPFYSVDLFDQSVPFYLGRTVILVKERGELAWGLERAPDRYIASVADFEATWSRQDRAFAIMTLPTYAELAAAGLPMRPLAQDRRRIVVARRLSG
ncbi:MAG: glycosyltransferase family 39 protein [Burkholderiales bacterium]|nr:glycosyltransferase family 39 protein [Burkholderiales bacterium]